MNMMIYVTPGPCSEIERPGLKTLAEPSKPFLGLLKHPVGAIKPVYGAHRKMLKERLGEHAFTAAQLDDSARPIEAWNKINDDLQLALPFRDKVTPIVNECLRRLLVPDTLMYHIS
jgi:hypothetical protein